MIHLKDSQRVTVSAIDAVVVSLNTTHAKSPDVIRHGLSMIHAAISKADRK